MRTGVILALVVALAAAAGCSQATTSPPPPRPTSIPKAVSYQNVQDLIAAIRAAGQPKLSDVWVSKLPSKLAPAAAHAQGGTLGVTAPGDKNPWLAFVALFPDAAWKRFGVTYGQHLAAGFNAPDIWQLQGPNWFFWGVGKQTLEAVRGAVGGELGHTRLAAPIPLARLSALARHFRPKQAWWTTLSRAEAERVLGASLKPGPDLTYVVLMKGDFKDVSGNPVPWAVSAGRPGDSATRVFGTPPQTYGHGWTALDLASPQPSP
jgi:hypothetical protein